MKKFEMTTEETKKFYEQVSKEEACYRALSAENIGSLVDMDENALNKYLKACEDRLAEVLAESNLFMLSLRKKYGLRAIHIENDYILAEDEDIITGKEEHICDGSCGCAK